MPGANGWLFVAGDEYALYVGSLPYRKKQRGDDPQSGTDQQNPKPPPAEYPLSFLTFVHVRPIALRSRLFIKPKPHIKNAKPARRSWPLPPLHSWPIGLSLVRRPELCPTCLSGLRQRL